MLWQPPHKHERYASTLTFPNKKIIHLWPCTTEIRRAHQSAQQSSVKYSRLSSMTTNRTSCNLSRLQLPSARRLRLAPAPTNTSYTMQHHPDRRDTTPTQQTSTFLLSISTRAHSRTLNTDDCSLHPICPPRVAATRSEHPTLPAAQLYAPPDSSICYIIIKVISENSGPCPPS